MVRMAVIVSEKFRWGIQGGGGKSGLVSWGAKNQRTLRKRGGGGKGRGKGGVSGRIPFTKKTMTLNKRADLTLQILVIRPPRGYYVAIPF